MAEFMKAMITTEDPKRLLALQKYINDRVTVYVGEANGDMATAGTQDPLDMTETSDHSAPETDEPVATV